ASTRFGYAAITWGGAVTQAIEDIGAVGFRGIQLRVEAFQQFGDKPAALKDLLQRHGLAFAVLSSGNLAIDPAREATDLATHLDHARFVRDAGGQFLQIIDERPKGRPIVADDYRRLGRLLTTLGQRTADIGVPLVYHHHMNSLGERPNEIASVLEAADRKHVRLLLDVAHYQQGGGDPVRAIRQYASWIQVVLLKDVVSTTGRLRAEGTTASPAEARTDRERAEAGRAGGSGGSGRSGGATAAGLRAEARSAEAGGYQFVELGRG